MSGCESAACLSGVCAWNGNQNLHVNWTVYVLTQMSFMVHASCECTCASCHSAGNRRMATGTCIPAPGAGRNMGCLCRLARTNITDQSMCCLCRLVRTNITDGLAPEQWEVVLPEHEKDILTGSTALEVRLMSMLTDRRCLCTPSKGVLRSG